MSITWRPETVVRDVGVGARDGHAMGIARRVHAAHDLGARGIRDVDHLETGLAVRDVGVGARDGHATGIARRVHAAHDLGALRDS